MKKMLLSIAPIILSLNAISQKADKLFEKGIDFYDGKEYDSALAIFTHIYEKGTGDLDIIAKAHYNIGEIHVRKKDTANAKKIFEQILRSNYNDNDKGGIGSGIMGEPYALYKHHCCTYLAEFALAEKKFDDALKYTQMFIVDYPYRHFCGNEYEASAIYSAYTLARCYEGLDQADRAIGILLQKSMYTGLASNEYLVELLSKLIKKRYSAEEIKKEFEKASAAVATRAKKNGKYKYNEYYTAIFKTEVTLYSFPDDRSFEAIKGLKDIELYRYCFVNSYLYRSVMTN